MQNRFGSAQIIPPVTQNLIIINALCWLASLVLPKFGIDLIEWMGLHVPGTKGFKFYQLITYMFMHDTHSFGHISSICLPFLCSDGFWKSLGDRNVF